MNKVGLEKAIEKECSASLCPTHFKVFQYRTILRTDLIILAHDVSVSTEI